MPAKQIIGGTSMNKLILNSNRTTNAIIVQTHNPLLNSRSMIIEREFRIKKFCCYHEYGVE